MSFSYVSSYDSPTVHGIDERSSQRPWDLKQEILNHSGQEVSLLDIGCGTASKLIPLAPHFKEMTGLDISKNMLDAAFDNIKKYKIENIKLVHGDSNKLPFENDSFDVITCMLSRWDINEIFRALKTNGTVIIEHIGCEDKKELKILFGKDKDGWRGQLIDFQKKEYLQHYQNMFTKFFNSFSIKNGYWKTYYTEQGLSDLLKYTPTIRDFDPSSQDNITLQQACLFFNKPEGIELTQNRILIHAKKS